MRRLALAILASASVLTTLGPSTVSAAGLPLTLVQGGFSSPIFLTHAFDGRLFVVEQTGRIKIVGGGTFLDISGLIAGGGERGLLGLAFHPNYTSNGLFYVNYTRAGDGATVIAEYHVPPGTPDSADPSSARTVLTIAQPFSNHNGGWMDFKDELLYIATGDGGGSGDSGNRAQSKSTLLGKILRIDPLDPPGEARYTIPGSNPFVGRTGKDEIWSLGLRNPWRCSFDRQTGQLYCGDVGQGLYEEIDRVATGKATNFGWRLLEGRHYYRYPNRTSGNLCTSGCKKLPILEYGHGAFGGGQCAVTGGYVSRRPGAALFGQYVFADYCSGDVWTIPSNFGGGSAPPAPVADTSYNVSSFGEDVSGFLYLVDLNGSIYRLDES